jgi:hypothetical protein
MFVRFVMALRGRRRWRPLAAVALALGLAVGAATTALAVTVSPVNTTFDRPSISAVPGGGYDIAWAGTDANGKVNVATLDSGAHVKTKWTDSSSSTAAGTGVALTHDPLLSFSLVAWADLGTTVHVELDTGNGPACASTGFGTSVDTPYLTVVADGTLYLTTVTSGGVMHVIEVDNSCVHEGFIGGSFTAGPSTTVTGNTSFVGPTLFDLNLSGTPNLWLVWAGTNSAHTINIAHFTPGSSNLGTKFTESNHATVTDLGSTTSSAGNAFFTYCGINNVVFGQHFSGNGPQAETAIGGSCAIFTSRSGFINGGVDVTFNGSSFANIFPNNGDRDLIINTF